MRSTLALVAILSFVVVAKGATSYAKPKLSSRQITAKANVNVRYTPCSGSVKALIRKGDTVQYTGKFITSCGHTWYKVQGSQFDGTGYTASEYYSKSSKKKRPSIPTRFEESCGQAYNNGKALGEMTCVRIDGKLVVTSTAKAFNVMKAAAANDGISLRINSGFRTMAEQQYLYKCYQTKTCNNGNKAAKPGTSNHQNGIAIDIHMNSQVYSWLGENASKYGFIRAVRSEIWHWELRPNLPCDAIVKYSCK
jgi:hypothetical protein